MMFDPNNPQPVMLNPQAIAQPSFMDKLMALTGYSQSPQAPPPMSQADQPSPSSQGMQALLPSGGTQSLVDPSATGPQSQGVSQDLWSPTHRNILGRLADAMIMAHGGHPVYEQRMEQRDLASAMDGYDPNNPTPTIQRIAQIPGMAEKALSLYQQMGTDQERNDARNVRNAAKKDLITQRLGGIAGVTTEQNFPQAQKLMRDYVTRWGEDPKDYDIPDSYDKDQLDLMSNGSITAKDQQAEQARQQALALHQVQADSLDQYRQARLGQLGTQEADRNSRFQQGLTVREQNFNRSHQGGGVVTDQGVPGVITPDGSRMMVLRNGVKYGYVRGGSQNGKINWVPVGPLQAQK